MVVRIAGGTMGDVIKPCHDVAVPCGRLPDFIIIGAAKAGTTALHESLRRHPQVFMPSGRFTTTNTPDGKERVVGLKEPAFFAARSEWIWELGVDWYRSLFSSAECDQVCGEASTTYTRFPHLPVAAPRMAAVVPRAKLIYVVREPVSRTYSHFIQMHSTELHPGEPFRYSFREFIERYPEVVDASCYYTQISRYLQHYSRDQILVVFHDDLIRSGAETLQRILRFIGVENSDHSLCSVSRVNVTSDRMQRRAKSEFRSALTRAGLDSASHLIPSPLRKILASAVFGATRHMWHRRVAPPPLTSVDAEYLSTRFQEEVEALAAYTGRDLSGWANGRTIESESCGK